MLHLANGEASVAALRRADAPGDAVCVDDVMAEGPLPNGLARERDWEERADDLARRFGIARDAYLASARGRLALLRALPEGEVVLWTEDDWHCQANLLHHLRVLDEAGAAKRVALADAGGARVGTSGAEGVRAVLAARRPLDPARVALAGRAWDAVSSPDPRDAERLLREADFAPWPSLARGLRLHLARLPSAVNGLDLVEALLLEALAHGNRPFRDAFAAVSQDPRAAALGLTDLQLARAAHDLAVGSSPLVRLAGAEVGDVRADGLDRLRVEATPLAAGVLAGRHDRVDLLGVDRWVGGVRLAGPRPPRWDALAERVQA